MRCRFDINYCTITWTMVLQDISIKSIQEPICEMFIDKEDFDDAYQKLMNTFDGRDLTSFVDFFWRRSPVDDSCLEFVDKDARLDIYEYLRDEKLIPDMDKVHSGDWKFKNNSSKNKKNDLASLTIQFFLPCKYLNPNLYFLPPRMQSFL